MLYWDHDIDHLIFSNLGQNWRIFKKTKFFLFIASIIILKRLLKMKKLLHMNKMLHFPWCFQKCTFPKYFKFDFYALVGSIISIKQNHQMRINDLIILFYNHYWYAIIKECVTDKPNLSDFKRNIIQMVFQINICLMRNEILFVCIIIAYS